MAYEALDAVLVREIKALQPIHFRELQSNPCVLDVVGIFQRLLPKDRFGAHQSELRIIDRRLQALRKRGVIVHTPDGWELCCHKEA